MNNNKAFTEDLKETVAVTDALNRSLAGSGRKKQQEVGVIASFGLEETGENPLEKFVAELPLYGERMTQQQQLMLENALAFNEGFSQIWQDTASGFLENLGTMLSGFATGNAGISDLARLVAGVDRGCRIYGWGSWPSVSGLP